MVSHMEKLGGGGGGVGHTRGEGGGISREHTHALHVHTITSCKVPTHLNT